jgi:hypothetical protein
LQVPFVKELDSVDRPFIFGGKSINRGFVRIHRHNDLLRLLGVVKQSSVHCLTERYQFNIATGDNLEKHKCAIEQFEMDGGGTVGFDFPVRSVDKLADFRVKEALALEGDRGLVGKIREEGVTVFQNVFGNVM